MPGMSGVKATRSILHLTPAIGIVMFTMLEDDASVFFSPCGPGRAATYLNLQIFERGWYPMCGLAFQGTAGVIDRGAYLPLISR
jgi:hypothetical protein